MNLFDWFLVAILAYSTIVAFMRGILLELFSLGGLIVGFLLAAWNYQALAAVFSRLITTVWVADLVAFLLIAVGVMVVSAVIGRTLHRTADAIGLGFFDRVLGAGFGFARGCLLGVAILITATGFLPKNDWIENSHLAPYFLAGVHAVSFVVPHDLQQQILDGAAQLKHNAPDWIKSHS
jgi:membrane protein required for colicin V production